MLYYLYQITNLVNNKIYVGVHKTKNINDGYMGSGKVIRSAIEKYGIENFDKVILETFDDQKEMYAREKEIVTEEFLSRKDVYNLRRGGFGGFEYINKNRKMFGSLTMQHELSERAVKKNAWLHKNNPVWKFKKDEQARRDLQKANKRKKELYPEGTFKGKKHSPETKDKMRKSKKNIGLGDKNSQFGTMWITNDIQNKKIKKTDIIPNGWHKGRSVRGQ